MHIPHFLCLLLSLSSFVLIAGEPKKQSETDFALVNLFKRLPRSVGMLIAQMAEEPLVRLTIIIKGREEICIGIHGSMKECDVIKTISKIVPVKLEDSIADNAKVITAASTPYEARAKRILFKNFYDNFVKEEAQKNKHKQ